MSIVGAVFQGQTQYAGRSYYSTKSTANNGNHIINPLRLVPKDLWQHELYETANETQEQQKSDEEEEINNGEINENQKDPKPVATPLLVRNVNLNIEENCMKHHTNVYNITKNSQNVDSEPYTENGLSADTAELVVRRGDTFTITVEFNKTYDRDTQEILLQFQLGNETIASKNTYITLNVREGLKQRRWSAGILAAENNKVTLEVRVPGDSIIGMWSVHIDTCNITVPPAEDADLPPPIRTIHRYRHGHPIFIIFNPWSTEDEVYMEETDLLNDYILAETGKIFMGNHRHTVARPWCFGQFEDFVLGCSLNLLDKAKLKIPVRNNPVLVAKALCSTICSSDGGILALNWTGNYDEGVSPCAWTGSVPILSQYDMQRENVKYGQCWTAAGVYATVCRALGIPCRIVTNYLSALDNDGTTTVDTHWNNAGEPVEEWNRDAIWSFHVWNEVWMSRSDLPSGYSGWQAVDSTPREMSQGLQTVGPVSVKAVREGDVYLPYGSSAFFASVNSDIRHWVHRDNLSWIQQTKKHGTGVLLVTKSTGVRERPKTTSSLHDKWEETITQSYKFKSDTELERKAIQKANLMCSCPKIKDKGTNEDVGFEFVFKDNLMVGHNFDVTIQLQNKSRLKRSVRLTLTCSSVYYTGVFKAKLRSDEQFVELSCIKASQATMRLNMGDYMHLITDQLCFRVSCQAEVLETGQIFAHWEDFRLDRPKINIVVPDVVVVGKPFQCHIQMQNPTSEFLTKNTWFIESPGIQKPMEIPFGRDVDPYETVTHKLMLTATESGCREIVVTFDSKELRDVTGVQEITVRQS